jgi:hypothetical protein
MTISKAVEHLAGELIAHAASEKDEALLRYLREIQLMPEWAEKRMLNEWETRAKQAQPFGDDPARDSYEELAEQIFDLGALNLYGAIRAASTVAEYERLHRVFALRGIEVLPASAFDFSRWS